MPLSAETLANASRTLSRNVYVMSESAASRAISLLASHWSGRRPDARVGNTAIAKAAERAKAGISIVVQTWPDKAPKVFVAVNHRDSFEIVEELAIDSKGVSPTPPTRKWSIPKTGRFSFIDELT